jgi:hypothetical protein
MTMVEDYIKKETALDATYQHMYNDETILREMVVTPILIRNIARKKAPRDERTP